MPFFLNFNYFLLIMVNLAAQMNTKHKRLINNLKGLKSGLKKI